MLEKCRHIFKKKDLVTFSHFLYLALLINFIIEILNRSSLLATLKHIITNPFVFLYNTLIILLTLSIAFLVKRRVFIVSIVSLIWIGFGITNAVLLSFRVTPFTAVDLTLSEEALPMMKLYLTKIEAVLIVLGALLAITAVVLLYIYAPRCKRQIKRIRNAICMAFLFGFILLLTSLGIHTNVLAKNFGNLADAYKDYGFVYCFTNSLVNTGIDKPKDYSAEKVEKLVDETLATQPTTAKPVTKKPNIIMIQLESLYDVTLMKNYTYSEDPLPNYHALQQQFSHGFLSVPAVGAGTANTEFEVLTGMDLDFFGPGEYPYKTILKETTCESAAYNLKELNYKTHAIHNNDGTFYGRNEVFRNLGFDTFTSIEYMHNIELNPMGWAKDKVLIDEIMNTLKSTKEQDFVYTISVQGHGKYPGSKDDFNTPDSRVLSTSDNVQLDYVPKGEYVPPTDSITVSGISEDRKCPFEYYVNQIHEMDAVLGELIKQLNTIKEDTILVFYGDHLPSLNIEDSDLLNGDIYQTSYVIWDNMGLPKETKDLQAHELTAYLFNKLNIHNGFITKVHQKENNSADYLKELKLLQYDMLYGNKAVFNGESPYKPSNLHMGIKDIVINNVVEGTDTIRITGKNFTEYSKVFLNDTELDTTYVNSSMLTIKKTKLADHDKITVGQKGDDKYILSYTEPFFYQTTTK